MVVFLLNILNGVSFGLVLFLVSAGLSLILGVMGMLNIAHGALYMVGAYVGWTVAIEYGLNFVLAILAAGLAAGIVGLLIERVFLRRLYGQALEQILLTFGFVYILTNLTQWVWGGIDKAPFTARVLTGSLSVFGLAYPKARIATIIIGFIVAFGLWWLQEKTRAGAIVRAGMEDKEMTVGLGINLELVSSAIFFLGAFVAGFAGIIGAQLVGAYLGSGFDMLNLALIVIIIGGVGSIQGALLGGILIGCVDSLGKTIFPTFAYFTMYLSMVIILMIKPSGLLGRKE